MAIFRIFFSAGILTEPAILFYQTSGKCNVRRRSFLHRNLYPVRSKIALFQKRESAIFDREYYIIVILMWINKITNVMDLDSYQSRTKILILLGFNLVWGCALWWSVADYGLGTSRDSAEYLFTSLSLAGGDGFISFMGHRYVLWPPLYPML
jgi:hypothetical protein